jgi:hypothetical protein
LSSEGYPTEFQTASVFSRLGFRVFQGNHIEQPNGSPREIDVEAWADAPRTQAHDPIIRCEFIVECKWSRDKPWVVFTSQGQRMSPKACISQSIASTLGSAVVTAAAGVEDCQRMALLNAPTGPGFGGRQAFTKGNDPVYSALMSVTGAAVHSARKYDRAFKRGVLPEACVVAFPVVVVDGELFAASYLEAEGRLQLTSSSHVRCHWRGSPDWNLHATVDIVTLAGLKEFLERRKPEVTELLAIMSRITDEIAKCFKSRSLAGLTFKELERHPLLRQFGAGIPLPPNLRKPRK